MLDIRRQIWVLGYEWNVRPLGDGGIQQRAQHPRNAFGAIHSADHKSHCEHLAEFKTLVPAALPAASRRDMLAVLRLTDHWVSKKETTSAARRAPWTREISRKRAAGEGSCARWD